MEPAAWTNDAKMTLAIQVVAREEPDLSEDELRSNVVLLQSLVPDLKPGPCAKHADVVRVAARLRTAAESLIVLRDELPDVDVSSLAARQPQLLLGGPEALREDLRQVKGLLAGCGPVGLRQLLQLHPQLLRPAAAASLLAEIARLFGFDAAGVEAGRGRAAALLGSSPELAGAADCLRSQARGDRDPEYLTDTTRAAG